MTDIEVLLADLGEVATREFTKKYIPLGLEQNKRFAKMMRIAGNDIEKIQTSQLLVKKILFLLDILMIL